MPGYGFSGEQKWSFVKHIATTDTDTELIAAPTAGSGRALVVQGLTLTITTAAAQAFNIEDDAASGPVQLFAAPGSLAVGTWIVDCGPLGVALTVEQALQFDTASAGVGATIAGFGYYREA